MYRRQYGADCISLMPTNLSGPGDDYNLETAHILPALLRKSRESRTLVPEQGRFGVRAPQQVFHVDDPADAVAFAMKHYTGEEDLNVGVGEDVSILELAELIADVVGWQGEFTRNTDMPDGTPRKLVDVNKVTELAWTASIGLREGTAGTYDWFPSRYDLGRTSDAQVLARIPHRHSGVDYAALTCLGNRPA